MTTETVSQESAIATLQQAAGDDNRPSTNTVLTALLAAEKTCKQQRQIYTTAHLTGNWQLRFATGVRKLQRGGIALGRGFYLPRWVPAGISFAFADAVGESGTIHNQIELAGMRLRLTGPCRYLPKKNLLAFDFSEMEVWLWGNSVYRGGFPGSKSAEEFGERAIAQLPFFAFFCVTPDFIAARGRGGGVALWVKV